jgi:hypothetical protein
MNESKPFLGTPTTFSKAYPSFRSLVIRVKNHGYLASPMQREQVYSKPSIPRVIPCPNPRCQQGGYDLTAIIITMEHERNTKFSAHYSCNGHEGTPKGRRKGNPCMNSVELEFEAEFNE